MPQLAFEFAPAESAYERYLRASRDLPEGEAELIALGKTVLREYARQRRRNQAAAESAIDRLQAIGLKLNGGPGTDYLRQGGGADRLEEALRAPDGKVPGWGQRGRYVIELDDCRLWVEMPGLLTRRDRRNCTAYPIDYERPWLSSYGEVELYLLLENSSVQAAVMRALNVYRQQKSWSSDQRRMVARELVPLWCDEDWDEEADQEIPAGPLLRPDDHPFWQEGGWLHSYVAAHPAPIFDPPAPPSTPAAKRRGRR